VVPDSVVQKKLSISQLRLAKAESIDKNYLSRIGNSLEV
jgi:hypothetical protein